MTSASEKRRILNEILESPEFKESKRYQELLVYLFEETLGGRVPKEFTIGIQFFGKDSSFDPKEDPTVRVYLNNLRKKLEHYYLTTQKFPPHKLTIPKCHYQVEFVATEERPPVHPKTSRSVLLASVILVVVAFVAGYIGGSSGRSSIEGIGASPIWREFVAQGSRPTLVVLGDFFFLYERRQDGTIGNFIRDLKINTPDDYKQVIKQNPEFAKRFVQSNFTYLRPSASWGLAQILPFLQHSGGGFSLKLASQFTVDDLKSNNIVFIGSFKTLYSLQNLLHVLDLDYTITPASVRISGGAGDSGKTFSPRDLKGGSYEKDFAVVAKGNGPEGSSLLFLLGFADSGVIEASRAVTDTTMLHEIQKRIPDASPLFFTLVVETEGLNQAIFKSEIQHLASIKSASTSPGPKQSDSSRSR